MYVSTTSKYIYIYIYIYIYTRHNAEPLGQRDTDQTTDVLLLCPRLLGGGIKQWCCLTSVCLSRTSGLSREQRPRKTKIGTEVAHVTRDSYTTFKVKRSKVKVTGAGAYCGGLPHSLLNAALHLTCLFWAAYIHFIIFNKRRGFAVINISVRVPVFTEAKTFLRFIILIIKTRALTFFATFLWSSNVPVRKSCTWNVGRMLVLLLECCDRTPQFSGLSPVRRVIGLHHCNHITRTYDSVTWYSDTNFTAFALHKSNIVTVLGY